MKINKKIIIYAFVLVILTQSVFAIGVAPASNILNFEPGLKKTYPLKIINNEQKEMVASIALRGDLADYVKLEKTSVEFKQGEYEKVIYYDLMMPDKLEKPGSHLTEIIISEQPTKSESTVSVSAAVISQLIVNVPYPGVYAEAKLHIDGGNLNKPSQFAIAVFNLGTLNLNGIYAIIDIFEDDKKIKTLETDTIDLKSKEKGRISAEWLPEKPGIYTVVAKVFYSTKTIELSQNFQVGGIDLLIESLSIPDFKLGEIVRTYILLTNNWNQKITNVFAEVAVRDENGRQVSDIKTSAIDIDKFSSSSAIGYWDTENIYPGKYLFEVAVDYNGLKFTRMFDAYVTQNQVRIGTEPTGMAVSQPLFNRPNVLLILLIILINLIILNVVLFIILKKKPPKIENLEPISKLLLFLR